MDPKTYERLAGADWDRITLRLGHYAAWRVRRLKWRTPRGEFLPAGKTVEDMVYEAIEKVWAEERAWDPGTQPDLMKHLMGVVDSLVSHLVTSADHIRVRRFPETEEGQEFEELLDKAHPGAPNAEYFPRPLPNPEEALLQQEGQQADEELFAALVQEISGDQELEKIIEAMMDGKVKAAEIAGYTGLEVKRVYRLREKLNRAVHRVETQLGRRLGELQAEG